MSIRVEVVVQIVWRSEKVCKEGQVIIGISILLVLVKNSLSVHLVVYEKDRELILKNLDFIQIINRIVGEECGNNICL